MASPVAFRDGDRFLRDLMSAGLAKHEFKSAGGLCFFRGERSALQLVDFGATKGRAGEFCTSFGVGIHFEAVERLLRPERLGELLSTVGKPLSVLKEWKKFPQWCFDGTSDPQQIASEIMSDFEKFGVPFFRQFGLLHAVRDP
jgi:hypothetical protein